MIHQKIDLDDLIQLDGETKVDIASLTEPVNPVHTLINDEITGFLEKPREEGRTPKVHFFSHVPSSKLKDTIDRLLKNKNKQEDRARKHLQFEFDRKMQRMNRIKSKTYRKMKRRDKIRKEEEIGSLLDESTQVEQSQEEAIPEPSNELDVEPQALFIKNSEIDPEQSIPAILTRQQEQVKSIFEDEEQGPNEQDFVSEKVAIVESEAPQISETVLPGWDDWAGADLICRKTDKNTVINIKEGVQPSDRKDFKHGHLIINENITVPEKYKSELPYGYSYKAYREKMKVPISLETTSTRILKKFVKLSNKADIIPGKNIDPVEYEPEY